MSAYSWGYNWIKNWQAETRAAISSSASGADAAFNAAGGGLYQVSDEAALWGKPIPITWGTRRITGQLLQIGIQRQETVVTETPSFPQFPDGILFSNPGVPVVQNNITFGSETKHYATFAYCFGAPGNPDAIQILKKLWFNGALVYDIDQGSLSPEVVFRLYQGDEEQLPDVELNKQRYTHPVAYRGLIYIVFYNYAMPVSAGAGNPTVEAEFAEQVTNTQPITRFDNYLDPLFVNFSSTGVMYDPKKDVIYVPGSDGRIYKFRGVDHRLIDDYPITGAVGSGPSPIFVGNAQSSTFCLVRSQGTPYLIMNLSNSNSRQVFLVNADTGVVVDSIGENSSSLSPSEDTIQGLQEATAYTYADVNGAEQAYVAAVDLFQCAYLFKINGPTIELVNFYDGPVEPSFAVALPSLGEGDIFIARGSVIYRNGEAWHTASMSVNHIIYSALDDTLIVFMGSSVDVWSIYKLDRNDQTILWQFDHDDYPLVKGFSPSGSLRLWRNSNTANQRVAWKSAGNISILNFLAGTLESTLDIAALGSTQHLYDAFTNSFSFVSGTGVSGTSSVSRHPIFQQTSSGILLSTFLRNVAERQGYETANITVTGIPDTIIGAAITQKTDIDSMLEDIRRCYNFTIIKRGESITFTRRGYGADFNVDASYNEAQRAIVAEDENEFLTVNTEIVAASQAAGTIKLRYIDPDYNYTVNEFTHKRNDPDYDVSVEMTLNLPIIMQGSEAASLAARALLDANMSGTTHEFRLPQRNIAHEPGDVIELQFDDYSDTVRAVEIAYNGDLSLSIKSEAIYSDIAPSYALEPPVIADPPPSLIQGEGEPLIFDTTLIRASDEVDVAALEMYVSAVPSGRLPMQGSNIIAKGVNGLTPTPSKTMDVPLTFGTALTQLSSGPVWQVNYDEVLSFRMVQGDETVFATATVLEVLAGANRLLVGTSGRWEQIGYIEASYNATLGEVTLTGLIRGLRGTELYASMHRSGDYVVPADDPAVLMMIDNLEDLGEASVFAVADGRGRLNLSDAKAVAILGIARRPWAPSNVHVVADGGDLDITWHRRTRLDGPLLNGTPDVPLDEGSEAYTLVLYRAGSVVRTVNLTTSAFTYTASMQTEDGWTGSITSIQLDVAQISEIVSGGFINSGVYDVE